MRILHLHHSCDPASGGPIEYTMQLSMKWLEMGHDVQWISLDVPGAPWVKEFPFPITPLGLWQHRYGLSPRVIDWLRKNANRFDVVLSHGLWQFQGLAAYHALKQGAPPYFVMVHGMLDPWFKATYPLKHLKKLAYWKLVENHVLHRARGVIFTCEEERLQAQNIFQPYHAREFVVVSGTQAPTGSPEELQAAFFKKFPHLRGKRLLLFLSRLHLKKGCDLLLKAFARHGGPLHLVIAGPEQEPAYVAELRSLAAGLPVTFTGMLGGDLKWGALSAADAFILPSHQENFGMAVAESLAVGTPVLISNKVNIWREIEADTAGLVETDDLPGTERLLQRWQNADHAAMRAAARRCFTTRFDIRKTAENMLEVLQS